eukprot:CAMPEP_0196747848 /NCGR_PEP_ID=MMETSP1091-20130531/71405_1 /TAXON_ID=302021 /ORGANISM="Rhodomonas sp., Strain CCMP768" /LENGTH=182 /DNA_ID=CAMNT_0042095065 /DNA_START=206 /DNA_END=753 /DNA_ORIENTATION=+
MSTGVSCGKDIAEGSGACQSCDGALAAAVRLGGTWSAEAPGCIADSAESAAAPLPLLKVWYPTPARRHAATTHPAAMPATTPDPILSPDSSPAAAPARIQLTAGVVVGWSLAAPCRAGALCPGLGRLGAAERLHGGDEILRAAGFDEGLRPLQTRVVGGDRLGRGLEGAGNGGVLVGGGRAD